MKKKKYIILLLLTLLIFMASGLYWGYQQVQRFASATLAIKQETLFTLPAGTRRTELDTLLVKEGIIEESFFFPWLLRLEPELARIKAGTYRLQPTMTVRQMLLLLVSGKEAQFSLRFTEGLRVQEVLAILRQAPYLQHQLSDKSEREIAKLLGLPEGTALEGRIFPDTYLYTANTADLALLKRAHHHLNTSLDEVWQGRASELPYKTADELLIMASIIEKETGVAAERTQVASVFVNRLRLGMRLQTDPTVIYGLGDNYKGTLTRTDLDTPTAYNTYAISGLPPTPIALPSQASLEAAAHPAAGNYLYFVATGKGGHTFSTNIDSHNQAVRAYRQVLKEKNDK